MDTVEVNRVFTNADKSAVSLEMCYLRSFLVPHAFTAHAPTVHPDYRYCDLFILNINLINKG